MALSLAPALFQSGPEKPITFPHKRYVVSKDSASSLFGSLSSGTGLRTLPWRCPPSQLKVDATQKRLHNFHRYAEAALADIVSTEKILEEVTLPKGEMWAIHKFGGTCVATSERIWNVAGIIAEDESDRKVVVVSAMSKVTDMLYDLVHKAQSRDNSYAAALDQVHEKHKATASDLLEGEDLDKFLSQLQIDVNNLKAMLRAIYIAGHATESFSDFVVGHGELWSAQMLAATIRKRGTPCVWMDTREVLVVNLASSNQVDPDFAASEEKLNKCWRGCDFEDTFLPRGMGNGKLTVYYLLLNKSYFGANVLHPRTIIPVMKYNIPITIRNVFNLSSPGTNICQPYVTEVEESQSCSDSLVKGFATIDNLALINVEGTGMAGVPGTASEIFSAVKDVGANVIMISQASSEHSVCFAVPEKEVIAVKEALQNRFREALEAGRLSQVDVISDCSILAAVGQRMASTPGVSATLFNALAKANINIRAIAQGCSEYNITVVVKREDSIKALRAVHSRFYLSKTTLAVGIIGPGLIGGTLLDQLRDQVIILARECGLKLELHDIPVQSLVPEPLQGSTSVEHFMHNLPNFDHEIAKKREEADSAGEVLRYVGVVDTLTNEGRVELRKYSKMHPFAQLSGSDNIIAFTTTRYNKQPLIVRGPGAGAEVTAGGVFSDILRLASYLGAPS